MPTRIIMRPEGVNESNLVKTIQEQPVGTIAPEIPALIVRTYDRKRLNDYLKMEAGTIEEVEARNNVDLNKITYAFIASTMMGLRVGLISPFLTKFFLRRIGVEPVSLYKVRSDYSSLKKIRDYRR